MHSNWEEMLPFYIAGTLPKNDTKRLENHLSRCEECSKSLADWHRIADVVRADAAGQMRDLPPLSRQVLSIASEQAGDRYNQPLAFTFGRAASSRSRFRSATITLVAAAFTVLLLGGIIALMVLGGALPIRIATPNADVVLLPTETQTPTESATITPIPSQTDVPASLTPIPSQTDMPASLTPVPSQTDVPASLTPIPSQTAVPPSATTIPSQTSVPLSPTPVPPSATTIPSQTTVPATITPIPSQTSVPPSPTPVPPSTTPRPQIIVIEPSATPVSPTPLIPTTIPSTVAPRSFVPPTEVTPPTEALLFPEATQEPQLFSMQALVFSGTCTIQGAVAGSAIDLHAGPGDEYAVINTFTQDDELTALARSDNGWIRAQYPFDGVNDWIGWVSADLVFLSGDCADLPLIPAVEATDEAPTPESTEETLVEATPEIEATVEIEATDDTLPIASPPPADSDAPVVVITVAVANLRAGPGTSYAIVGTARSGDRLPVSAQTTTSGVWYRVQKSGQSVWVAASIARLTPAGAFVPPAPTQPPSSATATVTPSPASAIASGSWSQTVTVLSASCDGTPAAGGTVPVSLLVDGDVITMFSTDAGSPYAITRVGAQTYSGSYVTASATVSVSLTFTAPTSYYGSAVATTADGCVTQFSWSGAYVGS